MHNTSAELYANALKPTDGDIRDRILTAILARRLQPGARLVEEELAKLFDVSRTKVRQALARLAQEGVVTVRRNHGATVAAPSSAQARHVFEFRRMVEPVLAASLARTCTAVQVRPLRRHMAAERAARRAGDDAGLIRLTGEFHLQLARLHGNTLLVRTLREAEALTCLCILRFGRAGPRHGAPACLPDEHGSILDAIAAHDPAKASSLMVDHLFNVESEMDLDERIDAAPPDLAAALIMPERAA